MSQTAEIISLAPDMPPRRIYATGRQFMGSSIFLESTGSTTDDLAVLDVFKNWLRQHYDCPGSPFRK